MLDAQQKLGGNIKSSLIYELEMLHFFTHTWKSLHITLQGRNYITSLQVKHFSVARLNLDENSKLGRNFGRN